MIFTLTLIIAIVFPIYLFAQTEFEGEVSGEWDTDGSPYIQVGDAQVPADESLTINPGVEVILGEDLTLTCNGHITAQGTEEDTIRFHGPEGVVDGSLILNTGEDTVRFQYCRFDSLESAIWMQEDTYLQVRNCFFLENHYSIEGRIIWVEVTNSYFIGLGEEGNIFMGQDRRLGYYDRTVVTFTDNLLHGWLEVKFHCQSAEVERNTGEPVIIDDDDHNPYLYFWDSRSVVCRENQGLRINTNNLNRGLREATVLNNISDRLISFYNAGNAQIVCDDNVCSSIGFTGARNATATGNIARYIGVHDGSQVTLTRNFGYLGLSGNDNVVEVTNSTMVSEQQRPNDPLTGVIHLSDDGNPHHGNRVILRNNILYGRQNISHAVGEGIAVEGEGYNCIYGVPMFYAEREDLLPNDITVDPLFRGGYNFDCRLRADSPCIDAGDPDSPEDPDGTRADIGCYYFDQANGEPPALNRRWDYYIGWHETFRYAAEAVDEGDALDIRFEGLPEWLEVEEEDDRRDFVRDSVVVSGEVPEDQEDFVFRVIATDDADREDTLSVRVMVYPYRVLTGIVHGVLDIDQSPFIVADTAWVPAGDSLVLPPGTELFFDNREDSLADRGSSILLSAGKIVAVGSERDSIYVLPFQEDEEGSGITLMANEEALSVFEYCHFEMLRFGSGYEGGNHSAQVRNCLFVGTGASIQGNSYETIIENNVCYGTGFSLIGRGRISNNNMIVSQTGMQINCDSENDTILVNNNNVFTEKSGFWDWGSKFALIQDNLFVSSVGGENLNGMNLSNSENVLDANVCAINNTIRGFWYGVHLQGAHLTATICNNIILNSTNYGLRSTFTSPPEGMFSNNVIFNSRGGFNLFNGWHEPDWTYLRVFNNLFLSDSILITIFDPEVDYDNFHYNAMFEIDSLGNEPSYIGKLTQTNANGDSCDANFNIYVDPRLANPDSLDFRLYSDSPLIDAGNPDSSFNDVDSTINDIGLYGGPYGMAYEYLDPNEVLSFDAQPHNFQVGNAYPNPFNATSHISIDIPYTGKTTFSLYDIQGRRVAHHSLQLIAGTHRQSLSEFLNTDISGLRSGLYVLTIEFGGKSINRKLILVK